MSWISGKCRMATSSLLWPNCGRPYIGSSMVKSWHRRRGFNILHWHLVSLSQDVESHRFLANCLKTVGMVRLVRTRRSQRIYVRVRSSSWHFRSVGDCCCATTTGAETFFASIRIQHARDSEAHQTIAAEEAMVFHRAVVSAHQRAP